MPRSPQAREPAPTQPSPPNSDHGHAAHPRSAFLRLHNCCIPDTFQERVQRRFRRRTGQLPFNNTQTAPYTKEIDAPESVGTLGVQRHLEVHDHHRLPARQVQRRPHLKDAMSKQLLGTARDFSPPRDIVINDVRRRPCRSRSHSTRHLLRGFTRAREQLRIFWTPETQQAVPKSLHRSTNPKDVALLASRRGLTPVA